MLEQQARQLSIYCGLYHIYILLLVQRRWYLQCLLPSSCLRWWCLFLFMLQIDECVKEEIELSRWRKNRWGKMPNNDFNPPYKNLPAHLEMVTWSLCSSVTLPFDTCEQFCQQRSEEQKTLITTSLYVFRANSVLTGDCGDFITCPGVEHVVCLVSKSPQCLTGRCCSLHTPFLWKVVNENASSGTQNYTFKWHEKFNGFWNTEHEAIAS